MVDNDMLEALSSLIAPIRQDLVELNGRISRLESKTSEIEEKMQGLQPDIMKGVTVLLDTEFSRNFNLIKERLDEIAVKMPSEDDMDIIDGRLAEHDDEFKVVRQDVATLRQDVDYLKKAQ